MADRQEDLGAWGGVVAEKAARILRNVQIFNYHRRPEKQRNLPKNALDSWEGVGQALKLSRLDPGATTQAAEVRLAL